MKKLGCSKGGEEDGIVSGDLGGLSINGLRIFGYMDTWERGNLLETNIRERLDRGVANANLFYMFPDVKVCHLSYSHSDHCLIVIKLENLLTQRRGAFGLRIGGH